MKKIINNKEFELMVANLLCAEEHVVDMLSSCKSSEREELLSFLKEIKEERNKILDFPEEKDRNKWCVVKHLLLAKYHSLEILNNQNTKECISLIDIYNNLTNLLNKSVNSEWNVNCNICKDDLILMKFFKRK